MNATPLLTITRAATANHIEAWQALKLIRETIETLGPIGCLRSSENVSCNPMHGHFLDEAEELAKGIQSIACTRSKEPNRCPCTR